MTYKLAKYINQNSIENIWSNIYGYSSVISNPNIQPPFEMYIVSRISTTANINISLLEKMLVDEVQVSYENAEKYEDRIERLEDSLWKMKSKLEMMLTKEEEVIEKGIDIEMAVLVLVEGFLYVGVIGETHVLLYRNNKLIDITKGLIDSNMMGFARTGSLKLNFDDRIITSTGEFVSINIDKILRVAESLDVSNLDSLFSPVPGGAFLMLADSSLNWKEITDDSINTNFDNIAFQSKHKYSQINLNTIDYENVTNDFDVKEKDLNTTIDDKNFYEDTQKSNLNLNNSDTNNYDKDQSNEFENLELNTDKNESVLLSEDQKINLNNLIFRLKEKFRLIKNSAQNFFLKAKKVILEILDKYLIQNKTTFLVIIKNFTFNLFFVVKTFVNNLINKKDLNKRYLTNSVNKNLRNNLSFRQRNRKILFIFVILLSLYFLINLRNSEIERQEKQRIAEIQNKINVFARNIDVLSKEAISVNIQNVDFKVQLLSNLTNLEQNITKEINLLSSDNDNLLANREFIQRLNIFRQQINDLNNKILLIEEVNQSNLRIITDFSKLFPQSNISDIAFTSITGQRLIYATDIKNNNVYKLNVDTGSVSVIQIPSGQQFVSPRIILKDSQGKILVYDNSSTNSITRINPLDSDSVQRISIPYQDTSNVVAAEVFPSNGSIYELRTSPNSYIHRRLPSGNSFVTGGSSFVQSNPPTWRIDPDFSNGIDIAVPYEVYVLIKGQGIKRYLSGGDNSINQNTFINLLPKDFESLKLATAFDVGIKNMVVADSINRRILLFDITQDSRKDLVFRKQFKYVDRSNIFSKIQEVILNEPSGGSSEIYVLDDNRIILLTF